MDQLFADIIFFTTGFKEATTILANAYHVSQLSQHLEPSIILAAVTKALEKRLDKIEINV